MRTAVSSRFSAVRESSVWPVAGMYIVHSGTVSTLRGGEQRSLGEYPRDWPGEFVGRHHDPFVRAQRGESLANE